MLDNAKKIRLKFNGWSDLHKISTVSRVDYADFNGLSFIPEFQAEEFKIAGVSPTTKSNRFRLNKTDFHVKMNDLRKSCHLGFMTPHFHVKKNDDSGCFRPEADPLVPLV